MKFAAFVALVAAQAPDCSGPADCPAESYGEGACCSQLIAAEVPEGATLEDFGGFS